MLGYLDLLVYLVLTVVLLFGYKLAISPFWRQIVKRMGLMKRYRDLQGVVVGKKENKLYSKFSLLFKLGRIRSVGSNELEEFLVELISQYRINHYNMHEAIDLTITRLDGAPHTKSALIRLSLAIKQAHSDNEIISAVDQFNYVYMTNWSRLLADNLKKSLIHGENVYQALEDILEEIKIMNGIYEKDRQMNNEALIMIKYVTPAIYLLSIYAMIAIIGFDFSKFIEYQFFHPVGFKFFSLILILVVVNIVIYLTYKQRKRDF